MRGVLDVIPPPAVPGHRREGSSQGGPGDVADEQCCGGKVRHRGGAQPLAQCQASAAPSFRRLGRMRAEARPDTTLWKGAGWTGLYGPLHAPGPCHDAPTHIDGFKPGKHGSRRRSFHPECPGVLQTDTGSLSRAGQSGRHICRS